MSLRHIITLFLAVIALSSCASKQGLFKSVASSNATENKASGQRLESKADTQVENDDEDGAFHIVGKGETLKQICDVYGLDLQAVAKINSLQTSDKLSTGQTVFLPASALLNDWDEKAGSFQKQLAQNENGRDMTLATLIRGAKHSSVPQLKYPVPKGVLTSPFGFRWGSFHTGLDIAAPIGQPVLACADGRVIFTGSRKRFRRYGNTVMLDHGKGVYTYYAHLSEIHVKKGQSIKKGQKIALVGNTGRSTGPHLHLEVRVNNQLYNPLAYIQEQELAGARLARRFSESPMGPVLAKWRVPDLITLNK